VQTVIIVIHLMLVSALIGVVLLQRSEGGGLGMGSGGGGGFMTGRGTANLLTRTTAFLAIGFFITSLFLSWLAGEQPAGHAGAADQRRAGRRRARHAAPAGAEAGAERSTGSALGIALLPCN
jgi:protein translocase SecG subunit